MASKKSGAAEGAAFSIPPQAAKSMARRIGLILRSERNASGGVPVAAFSNDGDGRVRMSCSVYDIEIEERIEGASVIRPGTATEECDGLVRRFSKAGGRMIVEGDADSHDGRQAVPLFGEGKSKSGGAEAIAGVQDFRHMLDRVSPAVSRDEKRIYLNGVFLHPSGEGEMSAVATDGLCLMRVILGVMGTGGKFAEWAAFEPENDHTPFPGMIVPTLAVRMAESFLEDRRGGSVALSLPGETGGMGGISLRSDSGAEGDPWSVRFRTIDGSFPNYLRVIPNEWSVSLDVSAFELHREMAGMDSREIIAARIVSENGGADATVALSRDRGEAEGAPMWCSVGGEGVSEGRTEILFKAGAGTASGMIEALGLHDRRAMAAAGCGMTIRMNPADEDEGVCPVTKPVEFVRAGEEGRTTCIVMPRR